MNRLAFDLYREFNKVQKYKRICCLRVVQCLLFLYTAFYVFLAKMQYIKSLWLNAKRKCFRIIQKNESCDVKSVCVSFKKMRFFYKKIFNNKKNADFIKNSM